MAILKWSAVVILAVLCSLPAVAQQATLQGVVTDQSGAPVPEAAVTITNLATGIAAHMRTNERGLYVFPFLQPGNYIIQVDKVSFAPQKMENLKLDVSKVARVDFLLTVGTVLQAVNVSGAATLLESESTQMGQVIENKRIVEMPLNQRNYLALAQLSPGVLPAQTSGVGGRNGRDDASVIAMGQRANQISVIVDGADNNSLASGGAGAFVATAVRPSVDAIGEFKVLTNNFSAEYGFRTGPKIIVSLKSGTNRLHGGLFEFLRNEKLDGTNFFANRSGARKPTYRQNQFGGVLGGPIRRDKTFFFVAYEGTRIRQGVSLSATVPSTLARGGDFSRELANLGRVYDPRTTTGSGADATRLPFPNAVIPKIWLDPVVSNIINLYPLPNVAGREFTSNNFFRSPANRNDAREIDGKVDHNFSERDRSFFRYSSYSNEQLVNGPLPKEAGGGSGQANNTTRRAKNLVANWTHVFSPLLYNAVRFDYTEMPSVISPLLQEPLNAKYGIKNAPGDTFNDNQNGGFSAFVPSAGFALLGVACCLPNSGNLVNYHAADDIVKQSGAHSLKAGVEWRRTRPYRNASRFRRGEFAFNGVYTAQQPNVAASRSNSGNPIADLLLGQAITTIVGNTSGETPVVPYWGMYFQDDWKITQNLTLNLGLRWEYYGSPGYIGGSKSGFGGVSNYITRYSGVPLNDPRMETFIKPKNDSDCGCEQDLRDFSPRIGLAWRVTPKTVFRMAGGVFFGGADSIINDHTAWASNPPEFTEVTRNGSNTVPAAIVQNGLPVIQLPASQPVLGAGVIAHPLANKVSYSSQWFSEVQRELTGNMVFAAGYQGTTGSRLAVSQDINFPGPSPSVPASQRLLRPQFGSLELRGVPMGHSSYHALTARVEKRFSKGLTFLSAYTWSHSIDNQAEFNDAGNTNPANPYNLRAERGSSNLDQRQSFTTSVTWELPLGRGHAFGSHLAPMLDAVVGGWQVGGIVVLRTGIPFEVSYPGDPQNSGTINRGDRIASGRLDNRTIDRWFDQTAFVQSAPGVFGNNGRNVLYGPGGRNLDFIMSKRFSLPWEGHSLQFRFESFNLSNTPRFGQPSGRLRAAATGTITTAGDPRRIQFGLKYAF